MSMNTSAADPSDNSRLHLPVVAAPIDRDPSAAALVDGSGVTAAIGLGDIIGSIAGALGI